MEKIRNEILEKLLDKVSDLGWNYTIWKEPEGNYNGWYREERNYVILSRQSPLGEDFSMVIDFDMEDVAESFRESLKEYSYAFDVNKHVEKWIPYRGQGGCPRNIRELVEDAEDIDGMIFALGYRVTQEIENNKRD